MLPIRSIPISLLLCAGAVAQAGPAVIRAQQPVTAFMTLTPRVTQIHSMRMQGDAPGTWTVALSRGGDVEIGSYDRIKGTYTPSNVAMLLNSPTTVEADLTLGPDLGANGQYVMFTRNGEVTIAYASRVGRQLMPSRVRNWPKGGRHPVMTKTKVIYARDAGGSSEIVMDGYSIMTSYPPQLSMHGSPVVLAKGGKNELLHSPRPVYGPDGDVEGLYYAVQVGTDTDLWFDADLDPQTPGMKVVDTTDAVLYGGVAGGHLMFDGATMVFDVEAAWLMGDVAKPGGPVYVSGAVASSGNLAATFVYLSAANVPAIKLPAPFDVGRLGIDLSSSVFLGAMQHVDASQEGSMRFSLPNDARLQGLDVPMQGLALDTSKLTFAWTNTAWIKVR